MNKKTALGIGIGVSVATVALGYLITKTAKAQTTVPVTLIANPIRTKLLIDGHEVETPAKINLALGRHTFAAVPKSPDLVVLYGFDRWTLNGRTIGYSTVVTIDIRAAGTVTAQYMIAECGRYPIIGVYAPGGQALTQKTYLPIET